MEALDLYNKGVARWVAFVSVGVGECQSEDSFVYFGAKPTQRPCMQDFLWDRKKTKKGNIPGQSTGESSQQQSEKGGC